MKTVTVLKTEDLKNYIIRFSPESNERFIQDFFYKITNRERDRLLGYPSINQSPGGSSWKSVRTGKYQASRIRIMCMKEKIDTRKLRTEYETSVEEAKIGSHRPAKIDKFTEELVWNAIGENL